MLRGKPGSGSSGSDDGNAIGVVFPLEGFIYRIVDGESRRCGATEYRRRTRVDGCVLMDVCRVVVMSSVRGHIDGRPGEGLHFYLHAEDRVEE